MWIISVFISINVYGQVGINTTNPKATLHIEGDNNVPKGVIIQVIQLMNYQI